MPLNEQPSKTFTQSSARDRLETKRHLDIFAMRGFVSGAVQKACNHLANNNIVNMQDPETAGIKPALLEILSRDILELPETPPGLILSSGSEANEIAAFLARKHSGRKKIVCSNLSHNSIKTAAQKLGMELIVVESRPENKFQMETAEVAELLEERGAEIALFNLNAGTTQLGNVEKLDPEVETACRKHAIRVHVDAAYGGFNIGLLPESAWPSGRFHTIVRSGVVKSITIDPHKFIGPTGCSALLFPNAENHALPNNNPEYFLGDASGFGTTRSAEIPAEAVKTMQTLGKKGLQNLALLCTATALKLEKYLKEFGIHTVRPVISGIVPVQLDSEEEAAFVRDELLKMGISASLLNIAGKGYQINGIRIVITPDVFYDDGLLKHIAFQIKKTTERFKGKDFKSRVIYEDLFGAFTEEDMYYRTIGQRPPKIAR